jgi:copper transport protein
VLQLAREPNGGKFVVIRPATRQRRLEKKPIPVTTTRPNHRAGLRSRWFVWSVALSVALVLSLHAIADAHATLLSSEPAAGATLAASPARIRLLFSEAMEPTLSTISLVGADGHSIALAVSGDPHDVHALIAPLDGVGSGEYRVVWHVISADGHPVGSSFLFAVGTAGAPPPELAGPPPAMTWGPAMLGAPLVPAVLRGLGVGFLMAEAGLLFFVVRFGQAAELRARPMRVALAASVGAPLFLALHFVAWQLNGSPNHQLDAAWMTSMMGSTVGRVELWRTLLSLLPLWALALARRPKLAAILTIPALFVSAAVGHSAAVHPLLAIPSKILHLVAVAAWLGGLLWLVTRERRERATMLTEALDVSSMSLIAVIVVVLSGVAQTLLLVPLHDLISAYGAIVGAKILGLAVLVAFGAYHRFRVLPRLAAPESGAGVAAAFRASLTREIAIVWIVILLGGFLAYVSPPAVAGQQHSSAIPESSQ